MAMAPLSLMLLTTEGPLFIAGFLLTLLILYRVSRRKLPLPPGPSPSIFSGNEKDLPQADPWKAFAEWSRTYGSPLVTFRVFGRRTIVLNTYQAAVDLLDLRAKLYSDRPRAWMLTELVGRGKAVFNVSSQNPRFPAYRRLMQHTLNPKAVINYAELMDQENRLFLERLENDPKGFVGHLRRNAGAIILRLAYGWTVTSDDDYFVRLMESIGAVNAELVRPGKFLVDTIPLLRFIPAWFPGAGFQRKAAAWRSTYSKIESIPHDWAKEQIKRGEYLDSFTSQHLVPADGHTVDEKEEDIIRWCGAGLYAGGADTTVSALTTFIFYMAKYPDIQRRAQAEIEDVVGKDTLPSVEDETRLPYVVAVMKESLRYGPVAPLGLPHRVVQDDEYLGYRIPKGATVVANIWSITHDPSVYPDPMVFNPDRFLPKEGPPQLDPRKIVFGYGRRVCPGQHFAEKSVFLNLARILARFSILKPLDAAGREYDPREEWTPSIAAHLKPFECRFVPREDHVKNM